MKNDISLEQVLQLLMEQNVIRPKRMAPIKTALKQYSQILGYNDPSKCLMTVCLKPDRIRNRLIDEHAPIGLGSNGLRNLKNNVSFVLRKAAESGIVSPLTELASWKDSNDTRLMPRRNEHIVSPKYKIDAVPPSLEKEIAVYREWSTRITNRTRPKTLRKRPISFRHHRATILQAAGYLVKYKRIEDNCITLLTIVDPKNAIDYVEWRIEQQRKYTAGAGIALAHIASIARYLEITAQSSEQKVMINQWLRQLRNFREGLGVPEKVQDQSKRWLNLNQLETVGRSIYPLNAVRIKELSRSTRYAVQNNSGEIPRDSVRTFRLYAFRVLQSLLIRLLIRIPLRQRNLREMLWNPSCPEEGKNLYKKDGAWRLRFRGTELKVAEVKGELHSVAHAFPTDLVQLLEEWLDKWRRIMIAGQKGANKGAESVSNGQEFVFLNCRGRPLALRQVTGLFERATFKFTGVAVNPHMIRTIYATEYIKTTNNFIDAAFMLGDCVKTVIDTYAKLLDEDCGKRADEWITQTLQGGSSDGLGAGRQSSVPTLKYPRGR